MKREQSVDNTPKGDVDKIGNSEDTMKRWSNMFITLKEMRTSGGVYILTR